MQDWAEQMENFQLCKLAIQDLKVQASEASLSSYFEAFRTQTLALQLLRLGD